MICKNSRKCVASASPLTKKRVHVLYRSKSDKIFKHASVQSVKPAEKLSDLWNLETGIERSWAACIR